jgi:Fe-S-cluster-containing dehydrogenase component
MKEFLSDYRYRVYSDSKRCDLCDGCANLCRAAATEIGLRNRQTMGPPLDMLIMVARAYKPAFRMNVFGGEVGAG